MNADRARSAPERADAAAWLAVAAGALGALMAVLDISIINSALPVIQGEIGASGTEGTWIGTSYLVAEIIVIPLSGWLQRLFGLRTLLLLAAGLFTAFSILCGLSHSLTMMIAGRAGQGFTGGVLIPTAQTIIATRLPARQQPVGTSLFSAVIILGPLFGPLLGGWLTEHVSWHYAFFLNLPVGIGLIALLLIGMPHQRADLDQLRNADWLGIAGLAMGMGGLTMVLEDGNREQWFASPTILALSLMSGLGFAMLGVGQFVARNPVIRLSLLRSRQFGSLVVMVIIIGVVIFGTSYSIPQFLSGIAGYNAVQSGQILLVAGIPTALMIPFTPRLVRLLDIRVSVAFGLSILALSSWMETDLSPDSGGTSFLASQLLRGFGSIFVSMFLNQAAIRSVPREWAADAAGLFNAARNLGGSLALAFVAIFQDQRVWLHSRRIEETLSANSVDVQDYVASQQAAGLDPYASLQATIQTQALTMTYVDLFSLMATAILVVIPLVLFLRPIPRGDAPSAIH